MEEQFFESQRVEQEGGEMEWGGVGLLALVQL